MKKKIDLLYRETFQDLETSPPDDVWQNIAASLPEEKDRRRVIPFWYKAAGIAAAIALLLTVYQNPFQTKEISGTTSASAGKPDHSFELLPVSEDFRETFLKASIVLEAAMMNTRNLRSQNAGNENLAAGSRELAMKQGPATAQALTDKVVSGNSLPEDSRTASTPVAGNQEKIAVKENLIAEDLPTRQDQKVKVAHAKPEKELLAHQPAVAETNERSSLSRRFSVTPTAGAVYFDNIGSGNAIDAQLADNRGSGEISMAYGVNLAYQVSEKIKIRTGVSKMNLSHNTQDVSFASAVNASAVETSLLSIASPASGSLNQNLGFIEIPVEMEYTLLNKKIGLSLIGGASTLFLDENRIALNTFSTSTDLGEAKNLNEVSFSTNIGIGVNYQFSPQFRLNVEPMFKYQLNTFNNTSGLNPYIFGVYSGLSYRF